MGREVVEDTAETTHTHIREAERRAHSLELQPNPKPIRVFKVVVLGAGEGIQLTPTHSALCSAVKATARSRFKARVKHSGTPRNGEPPERKLHIFVYLTAYTYTL